MLEQSMTLHELAICPKQHSLDVASNAQVEDRRRRPPPVIGLVDSEECVLEKIRQRCAIHTGTKTMKMKRRCANEKRADLAEWGNYNETKPPENLEAGG
jgi:hypothetical protein